MVNKIISAVIFSLLLKSCSTKNVKTNLPVQNDTILIKGIDRDIVKNEKGELAYDYFHAKQYEGIAGFKRLDNGFDSLCIRINYRYSFDRRAQVVEIRKLKSGWEAEFFSLLNSYYPDSDSLLSVRNTSTLKTPKSGWNDFLNKLFALDILTLPDQYYLKNYNAPTDGNGVTVQIASKYTYRIYGYSSPYNNTYIEPVKKMEDIMELIEKEFGEKRLKKI